MGFFSALRSQSVERNEVSDITEALELRIKAHIGDIHVHMTEPNQPARVHLVTQDHPDQNHSARIIVQMDPVKRTMFIDTTPLKRFLSTVEVDITVWVPPSSSAHIQAATADMHIDGSYQQLTLNSAAGDINVSGVVHKADIRSASGDITATRCTAESLHITTASGDISSGPCTQTLTIATASGDITGAAAAKANIQTASGDVRIRVDNPTHTTIQTASGDIRIDIAPGFVTDVNAKTLSGDIHSNLTFDDDTSSADAADVQLHIQSLSGDIAIRK